MTNGRRRALLLAASISASGVVGSAASTLSGCDTGNAASPHNAANLDSGLGSPASDSGTVVADSSADAAVQDTGTADGGLNGCSTYVNHTVDAAVDLDWQITGFLTNPNRCSTITAGSSVKWTGSFIAHPLEPMGGDPSNPITSTAAEGGAAIITFTNPGLYGYDCSNHPKLMLGAIAVVGPSDAGGD